MLTGLRRRKRGLVLTTLVAVLAGTAFAFSATPRYTAEARVIVDKFDTAFSRSDRADDSTSDISEQLVTSQLGVLRSRDIAKRVAEILGLTDNAERTRRPGVARHANTRGSRPRRRPAQEDAGAAAIENYYRNLVVYVVPKSQVIAIEFTSPLAGDGGEIRQYHG